MRAIVALLAITFAACVVGTGLQAQTTKDQPPAASQGSPPAAAPTPAPVATPTPPPGPKAKDFQGLDVFGSDGKQLGKVVKAAELTDGKAGDLEVHSSGFFGFFGSVYVVPADKATLKNGRVDLSMSSEQAKQLRK